MSSHICALAFPYTQYTSRWLHKPHWSNCTILKRMRICLYVHFYNFIYENKHKGKYFVASMNGSSLPWIYWNITENCARTFTVVSDTLSNNANINSITHLKDHAARLQYALRSIRRCKFHCDECYESFGCENSSEMPCFSECRLIEGSQQKAVQIIHQKFWMTEERDYRCCGCHKNLAYQLSYTRNNYRPVKKESASMKTCVVLWVCKGAMLVSHAAAPLHWNHNWQAKRVTRHTNSVALHLPLYSKMA